MDMDSKKRALVVEGGGMRGVFSSGVLDAFMERDYYDFGFFIGVSAGAANMASYLSGQYKRTLRFYSEYMPGNRIFSLGRMLRGGPYMDADWIFGTGNELEPLDEAAVFKRLIGKSFLIVSTDVISGKPIYSEPTPADLRFLMRCSCSLPLITGAFPELGGWPVTDGGVSDPIPVQAAYRLGARRVTVIRSRPADVLKKKERAAGLSSFLLRKLPQLSRAVREQHEIYNQAVGFINDPPPDLEVIQIAPSRALKTKRTSLNKDDMLSDYEMGLEEGRAILSTYFSGAPAPVRE